MESGGEVLSSSQAEWSEEAAALHGERCALHVGAACGSEGMLEILLQNAAAVDAEDPNGISRCSSLSREVSVEMQLIDLRCIS